MQVHASPQDEVLKRMHGSLQNCGTVNRVTIKMDKMGNPKASVVGLASLG